MTIIINSITTAIMTVMICDDHGNFHEFHHDWHDHGDGDYNYDGPADDHGAGHDCYDDLMQ